MLTATCWMFSVRFSAVTITSWTCTEPSASLEAVVASALAARTAAGAIMVDASRATAKDRRVATHGNVVG